jgi:hypothetical protein
MKPKDPARWNEPLVKTPTGVLTKQKIFDYYSVPQIQKQILDAVGKREVVVRQSFEVGKDILRRKTPQGGFIKLDKPKFKNLIETRATEFHPTFGKKTDLLLADIDPRKNVPWAKTKAITEAIAKTMKMHPDVKDVQVRFSGGRGFYVQGKLDKAINVDRARELSKKLLDNIAQRPDVTFGIAHRPDEIRIDTTPLKFRGSIRAPFSLNAATGLVSAPVSLEKLQKIEKSDFTVDKILRSFKKKAESLPGFETPFTSETAHYSEAKSKAKEMLSNWRKSMRMRKLSAPKGEFAPGIPKKRVTQPIPDTENKSWQLAIQQHDAFKAGPHWDVRLVDPVTHHAHSFVVPKMKFPEKGEAVLGIQQPTHKSRYALKFEGDIPKGVYGGGSVKMHLKEPVDVIKANANRILFQRPSGEQYQMFRMHDKKWGIRLTAPKP